MKLKNIYFVGAKEFKNEKLVKISEIPVEKEIKSFFILSGLKKVEGFYKDEGFLDFKIIDYKIFKRGRHDILYVYVYEGNRKIVKNVIINPDTLSYVFEFLKIKPPFFYREEIFSEFEKKLYTFFTERGFVFFNFNRKLEIKSDSVYIYYDLRTGKKVLVRDIEILGLSPTTRKKIALDEIEIKRGEYISLNKIYLSIKNLYATGIFKNVEYEIVPGVDSTEADVIFKLREEKMKVIRLGLGYSSDGYSQGKFELEHLNIFNNAQRFALLTKFQFNLKIFLHQEFSLRYQDPHFVFRKNILELLPFYYIDRLEDVKKYGFNARYILKRDIWIFETNLTWQTIRSIERKVELFYLNGIGFSYSIDERDNILNPQKGYYFYSYLNTYGSILGGTANMIKMGYNIYFFKKLKSYIFALKFSEGHELPYLPSKEIPYSERFLMGGEGTIRGVKRYSIGDYDPREGIDKSGTNFFITNFEMRKILKSNLQFIMFFDIGSLSNIFSYKSFKNTGIGFGTGIRYFIINIVPLRFDIATNPHVLKTKELYLYFGIGHYF